MQSTAVLTSAKWERAECSLTKHAGPENVGEVGMQTCPNSNLISTAFPASEIFSEEQGHPIEEQNI